MDPLDKWSIFPDYSGMTDHHATEPTDRLALDAEQLRILLEPTRTAIAELLSDGPATTSQIADALGKPKGTVGHHLKAMESAGLVRVVRTERVRAIEAKYYARTARTFLLDSSEEIEIDPGFFLRRALDDVTEATGHRERLEGLPGIGSLRHARIPDDRAAEWSARLAALVEEFVEQPRGGETRYALVVGLFPTARPSVGGEPR
jgi:DNA-binding transcriptional ArsR family regulator